VFGARSSGLFNRVALPDEAGRRVEQALSAVKQADVNDLLNRDLDVLVNEMLRPFQRATVRWDDVTATEPAPKTATATDVFGHRVSLSVATITFSVPVDGDPRLLTYFSHSGAPMGGIDGRVEAGVVEFDWEGQLATEQSALLQWFRRRQEEVERFLANNNRDVDPLNQQMQETVRAAIERRRQAELARRDLAGRLPFPVARRPGSSRPVAVQRKQLRLQRTAPAPMPRARARPRGIGVRRHSRRLHFVRDGVRADSVR